MSLYPQESCEENVASLGMACSVTGSPALALRSVNVLTELLPRGPAGGVFGGSALRSAIVAAHIQGRLCILGPKKPLWAVRTNGA